MGRDNFISATKPIFPSYLLPSIKIPFIRNRRRTSTSSASSASSASSDLSPTAPSEAPSEGSSTVTTPASSPQTDKHSGFREAQLTRISPDTLRCMHCATDLAFASQIVSKGFTGRYGKAFLVAPPPLPAEQNLMNVRVGKSENRQLVTGWHVVADISCATCLSKLGWKYVDAVEQSQKYKVDKFILETERVVTYSHWEHVPGGKDRLSEIEGVSNTGEMKKDPDSISFNSDDEDECEDMFAGTWNPNEVARRRSQMVTR